MAETPAPAGTRVYVGNLSYETRAPALEDLMKSAGTVKSAEVLMDDRNRSKGGAYDFSQLQLDLYHVVSSGPVIVEYATAEDAQNAIRTLQDTLLDGRKIFVREDRESGPRSKPQGDIAGRKLFIGNLSYSVKWQQLKDHFGAAGVVVRANINEDYNHRSKGSGTVLFATQEEAQKAIEMFDGQEFEGRKIMVREDKFAQPRQ